MSEAAPPLEGVNAQAEAFEQAYARGRLHHAWLLTGPEGVGKASFAHRAALRLLGAEPASRFGPLGSAPDDPVARVIAAQAHPDFLRLERRSEDGKLKKAISVEDARRLPEFFAKSPAMARFRVAIIDSADDLNVSSANALLKTLEEPSGRGVLFLVAHNPGSLLPTIRSRCRILRFPPWPEAAVVRFVEQRLGLDLVDAERLARLAGGAPGRALSLHAAGALELEAQIAALVERLPATDDRAAFALSDKFRGGEGAGRFAMVMSLLSDRVRREAERAGKGAGAERWAAAWQRLSALVPQVEALNLDRADAFGVVMSELRQAARVQAPGVLIDSHVNLHAPQFAEDQAEVIARARAAGVARMVTICDRLDRFEAVHAIAAANPDIDCTVGVHPHEAKDFRDLEPETLILLAAREKVVGIGETGLDFHYDLSPRDVQRAVFAIHIAAARETGLPLVVHAREADADVSAMLEDAALAGPLTILLHCFTSGAELARRAAALGAYFSVSGIASFKAAEDVRAVIRDMPAERIIVETDCPYLAPAPFRGRRNEPAYLPQVLRALADVRGWSLEEAEQRSEDAFFRLFTKVPRERVPRP